MAGPSARPNPAVQPKLRLDKWLWVARFFKTRALASEVVEKGRCRINGRRCYKPGHGVGAGDVLSFAQGYAIRVVRIVALRDQRGPPDLAQILYDDLDPAATPTPLE